MNLLKIGPRIDWTCCHATFSLDSLLFCSQPFFSSSRKPKRFLFVCLFVCLRDDHQLRWIPWMVRPGLNLYSLSPSGSETQFGWRKSTQSNTKKKAIVQFTVWDSETPETPKTPRLPRLRDSRGFCHITFQFSFISDLPLFQIFQILQILKWKWKWKDPTFAIFLKNMGFKDVEYNIPETLRLPRLPRLWDSETLRQKEDKTTKCKNAGPPSTIIEHC